VPVGGTGKVQKLKLREKYAPVQVNMPAG